jgi:transcriptional regulator with XRE-family HTH domain
MKAKMKVKTALRATQRDRIRDAMIARGIAGAGELARRLNLPRQTVHRWLRGSIKNMTYENLFRLADHLNVSARWLAVGDVDPSKYMVKDEQEVEMMAIIREMSVHTRAQWLAIGRSLLAVQGDGRGTKVNPFPRDKTRQ